MGIFGRLLPRNTGFFVFFEKHAEVVLEAVQLLSDMLPKPPSEQVPLSAKIGALEKKADAIAHECVETLHHTFITPFERNDIHHLISGLDDIIDMVEDVASRIVIYKLDTRKKDVIPLASILEASVKVVQSILLALSSSQNLDTAKPLFQRIHELENEGDDQVRRAIANLFDEEKDPIALMKWKEIYESLEDAIDCCELVAHIVEGVMIENS